MSYLVPQQPQSFNSTIRRFEPAYWEVDFNPECIATVLTTGANAIRVKALLRSNNCLVGLYFRSRDKWGHPLFSYKPVYDWRNCVLSFDLTYDTGPLINDATLALVMTVTDISGKPHYVYLQNFMTAGSPASRSGSFSINFSTAQSGLIPSVPVPWEAIDNIFIGFTSTGYVKGAALAPITETSLQVDMTNITVTGSNSTIPINTTALTAHTLRIADGYADSYPQTPARIVDQIVKLGYRGNVTLYVGFHQFTSITWDGGLGRFQVDSSKPKVNVPSQQWITDYCTRLAAAGIGITMSVSFELLNQYAPDAWVQKDYKNSPSLSGWTPPSSFVSPTSTAGQQYLKDVSVAFVNLSVAAGCTTRYQVGEPWWWPGGYNDNGPCFYDASVTAAYLADTGLAIPTPKIQTIYDDYSAAPQTAFLTWLRGKLGAATIAMRDAVKTAQPATQCGVLFYTPTVSNPLAPMMQLVNFPASTWTNPAWDFVQVEDYEVIEFGNFYQQRLDLDVPIKDLGYPLSKCEYFSGFNLLDATTFIWDKIDYALWQALVLKSYPVALVWARPQVTRDGWVYDQLDYPAYAAALPAPSYPVFPSVDKLGWPVSRRPSFNGTISYHVSGKEIRSPNAVFPNWEFDLTYEILPSNATFAYQQLKSFFQSMAGKNGKFLFSDPEFNTATAQFIGTGDAYRTVWPFVRSIGTIYEEPVGAINSVTGVYLNGVLQSPATYAVWYNEKWPSIKFNTPPAAGVTVTATFTYYFVCRFYSDNQVYEEFMKDMHKAKTVKFVSVKP